jgi:CRISPR-associated endonuclease/helicase Cas3
MTINSHQGKPLIEHLKEVASNCRHVISKRRWLENSPVSQEIMENIAYLCGSFHDLGKATEYFQFYLGTNGEKTNGPKNHALISSLFVREVVRKYLASTNLSEFDRELLVTFAYTAVRRHHGRLRNLEDEIELADKAKELNEIIDAFHAKESQEIIDYFLVPLNLAYEFSEFRSYIKSQKFKKDLPAFYEDEIEFGNYHERTLSEQIQYFYLHQLLYSTLLFADKTDVIVDVVTNSGQRFPLNGVEEYRKRHGFDTIKTELDKYKNQAYQESIDNLKKVFIPTHHIYSLTLPTGLGKTLTSMGVALELKKMVPDLVRLIISIPFTSIIDQNYEVYREVANTDDSTVILKHHHQAEPAYKVADEDLKPAVSQFLIETWQSQVVVTTFVQLLNSVFSADKSLLMKLPSLANSVVILDEIQTIDFKHWQLINQVFTELGSLLNCYFILMSATQPLIFLPETEIREIVPNHKSYFRLFNRTKLINKAAVPISMSDFVGEVATYAYHNPTKDLLLILNTKKSCLDVFNSLLECIDTDKCNLYFMSTLITPYERKRIIGFLKNKTSDKQQIVVTTQLVEAGVDISVDAVFRVLAPVDALIQAAGRANRYNEKGYPCDVFLYEIEESIRGSQQVYGAALLLKTKNVFKDISEIEENDYLRLIESYFKEIRKQSDSFNVEYLRNIARLEFHNLGQFSLIEERQTESLFVQINEDAVQVWNEYCTIYNNPDLSIFDKRLTFGKIKARFYDFVVNVPVYTPGLPIDFDSEKVLGFYLVRLGKPTPFYPYSEINFLMNTGYRTVRTVFD